MRYVYDYEMHSPLNSPFHSDGLSYSYSNDMPTSEQGARFEKKLVLHYVINHSFELLLENYAEKLSIRLDEVLLTQLIQFTVAIFKRLQLSLVNFQKLLLLLNRYLSKVNSLQLSLKQTILALLIKIIGITSTNWSDVSGLPLNTIYALMKFVDADMEAEDYEFSAEELTMINDKMKALIHSRFDVI